MKNCSICGATMHRRPDETPYRFNKRRTCSAVCGRSLAGKNKTAKVEVPEKWCVWCGVMMARKDGEKACDFRKRLTCSQSCQFAHSARKCKETKGAQRRQPDRIGRIPVGKDQWAEVDPDDHELVSGYVWFLHPSTDSPDIFYAVTRIDGRQVSMHQMILKCPPGTLIDHRDRDGLNNRRSNLRPATYSQNAMNRKRDARNTSGFKGVSWNKDCRRWRTLIRSHGKIVHVGLFDSPEDAARAYDDAARRLFGEFARLNFPRDGEQAA